MTIKNALEKRRPWLPAIGYCGILALAIPWYWPEDDHTLVFGFPGWVLVAIGMSLCASVLTALLLRKPWPSEEKTKTGDHES